MDEKIIGWVARDAYDDAMNGVGLILHHTKPIRYEREWSSATILMHLPWSMFPDIVWEDEPIEVEVIFKRK